MNNRLAVRYIVSEIASLAGMGVALFWAAGRLDWWPAWGALAVMAGWLAATAVIVLRANPALLAERLGRPRGAKSWDAVIVSLMGLVTLARYIVAGLDRRYGWTEDVSLAARLAALAVCAAGYGLFVWATAVNAFFSRVVRIQSERGHTTVTDGPYRCVRHPAYLGALAYELAVPILLGSGWALLVSAVSAGMLVLRTALEDWTLWTELPGYQAYAGRVRYRLVPGIW